MSIELSSDGSYTLFNSNYQESYHSLKDGAISETLFKHIFPCFEYAIFGEKIRVLDICFGLGYNTFFTLKHFLSSHYPQSLEIYSPEKDELLLPSLLSFSYPKEIESFEGISLKEILEALNSQQVFNAPNYKIQCFIGDAIEFIKQFPDNFFDIIYQDAFSPSKNAELWSEEYFALLYRKLSENGVISTYSQSGAVRDNAKRAKFFVYEITQDLTRNSRIFCKKEQNCKKLRQK